MTSFSCKRLPHPALVSLAMDPAPEMEEVIGGERVLLKPSAVQTIKTHVVLEAKLSVGTEKSFLISLSKDV